MHACGIFSQRGGKPGRSGRGTHLGERGPPKIVMQGTFHAILGRPWRHSPGIPVLARSRVEDRARSAWLFSEPGDPTAGPQPWKGDPDRRPLVPRARLRDGRQRARRQPGRVGSGNVASLPPGEEMWGPRVGDRLGWVVLAGPPIPISRPEGAPPRSTAPRCSGLHHVGSCGEGPQRVSGCGNPELGGVSEGFPRKDSRAGTPTPNALSGLVPNLRTCGIHPGSVATAETHPHLPQIPLPSECP